MRCGMDKKTSRRLLCIAMVFFWASEYCHAPYFTPYLESLGFAAQAIGVMVGAYGFTQIFARIPIGIATDAFNCYKTTILFGTISTTLSSFFLMFATEMWSILICRVMAGLAASTWLAFSVLYNAYFKDDESVTAMTNANAFNNGGKLLAFFLGILTATRWGYKVPLLCSFLTGLVAVVAVILLKPIEIKHESFSFKHALDIIKTPMIIVAALFAMLPQFYMQGTAFSFTSSKAKLLGASSFVIGMISLVFTLVQVLISPYVGKKLLKRMKSSSAVCLGLILLSLSCVSIAFANTPLLLILGNIIGGVGCLILNALLMSLIVRSVSEEKRSTAMGFYQAVYGIGMTLGPVLMGNLVGDKGYSFAYMTIAIIMAVFAIVALPVVSKAEKKLK